MNGDTPTTALLEAVEAAQRNGELWPRVFELLAGYGAPMRREQAGQPAKRQLTQAEQAVLNHLLAGRTPAEIAAMEAVSVSTVRTHIARLHEKYGVSRTLDVVRLAMAEAAARPQPSEAAEMPSTKAF